MRDKILQLRAKAFNEIKELIDPYSLDFCHTPDGYKLDDIKEIIETYDNEIEKLAT